MTALGLFEDRARRGRIAPASHPGRARAPVVREPGLEDGAHGGVAGVELAEVVELREAVGEVGVERDGDELVVPFVVLAHLEHADHAGLRDRSALEASPEHEDVEAITVVGERARDHPVVHGERQVVDLAPPAVISIAPPVEPAIGIIHLELGRGAGRDLDDGVDAPGTLGRIVPRVVPRADDGIRIESDGIGRDGSPADDRAPRDRTAGARGEEHEQEET